MLTQRGNYLAASKSLEAIPFLLRCADTHSLFMPSSAGWGSVLQWEGIHNLSTYIESSTAGPVLEFTKANGEAVFPAFQKINSETKWCKDAKYNLWVIIQ